MYLTLEVNTYELVIQNYIPITSANPLFEYQEKTVGLAKN